jgi:hypothetical protein
MFRPNLAIVRCLAIVSTGVIEVALIFKYNKQQLVYSYHCFPTSLRILFLLFLSAVIRTVLCSRL